MDDCSTTEGNGVVIVIRCDVTLILFWVARMGLGYPTIIFEFSAKSGTRTHLGQKTVEFHHLIVEKRCTTVRSATGRKPLMDFDDCQSIVTEFRVVVHLSLKLYFDRIDKLSLNVIVLAHPRFIRTIDIGVFEMSGIVNDGPATNQLVLSHMRCVAWVYRDIMFPPCRSQSIVPPPVTESRILYFISGPLNHPAGGRA